MFKIVKDTTKSIREKCQLVETPISQEIKDLALEMVEYLIKSQDDEYAEKHGIRSGVGLAAPQIGVQKRIFAVYYPTEDGIVQFALINPKIIQNSFKFGTPILTINSLKRLDADSLGSLDIPCTIIDKKCLFGLHISIGKHLAINLLGGL